MTLRATILRSTAGLILISLLVKAAGYGEKLVIAYYFGTGEASDAYTVILGVVMSIFILSRELVEPGFLNTFLKNREAGKEKQAWELFNTIAVMLLAVTMAISLSAMVFPGFFLDIFAPGFKAETREMAAQMLQFSAPGIALLSLSSLTYITLNAMKQFAVPALGDLSFKGMTILCLILLYGQIGVMALGLAIFAGAIGRLLVHLIPLRKFFNFSKLNFRSEAMKDMALLTLPIAFGVLFSQASNLIDNALGSTLEEGVLSALSYAKKTIEMPIVVLPYALGIVAFPYFSQLALTKKTQDLRNLFGDASHWIFLLFLPIALLTFTLAPEITQLLFERGAFDAHSTQLTSLPMKIYAIGIPTFAIETILVLLYFSMGDTRTPILWGIIGVVINIFLTYILIQYWGYIGIAWATVASKSIKVIVLLILLRKKFTINTLIIGKAAMQMLAAAAVMAISIFTLTSLWHPDLTGKLGILIYLAGVSGVALVVFALAAYLLGIRLRSPKDSTDQ